jgi:hypothetical protein
MSLQPQPSLSILDATPQPLSPIPPPPPPTPELSPVDARLCRPRQASPRRQRLTQPHIPRQHQPLIQVAHQQPHPRAPGRQQRCVVDVGLGVVYLARVPQPRLVCGMGVCGRQRG